MFRVSVVASPVNRERLLVVAIHSTERVGSVGQSIEYVAQLRSWWDIRGTRRDPARQSGPVVPHLR
jgi:hypothetical protein